MENYYILYETTNLINGKNYRGIHKTSKLEDGYLGSGLALEKSIKKYGRENFRREILEFCNSYEELLEKEALYVDEEWVKDKSNYNLKTGGQSAGILSDESKKKISETLKRKYESGEIIAVGNLGGIPWNKDKKDIYSENSLITMSISAKNRYYVDDNHPLKIYRCVTPWNKGLELGPMTEEEKEKRSKTLKERWKTQEHHSKGVEPWNKGTKGLQEAWNKGKEMEKTECPHCGKLVDIGNGKRWHFDKCKQKPVE